MIKEDKTSEHQLAKEVTGTTLKVYLHLLKVKHASAREVYRSLKMSSPYLATYHLDKLGSLKLVNKDTNGTYNVKPKSFGILRFSTVTGKWIVPRSFFYTVLFLVMGFYFLFTLSAKYNVIILAAWLIPALINIVETILFYKTLSNSIYDHVST